MLRTTFGFAVFCLISGFTVSDAVANEDRDRLIVAECRKFIGQYVSGTLASNGMPDRSAIYMSVSKDGFCTYGYSSDNATISQARSVARRYCINGSAGKDLVIKCTFVGQDKAITAGVAKFYNQ